MKSKVCLCALLDLEKGFVRCSLEALSGAASYFEKVLPCAALKLWKRICANNIIFVVVLKVVRSAFFCGCCVENFQNFLRCLRQC